MGTASWPTTSAGTRISGGGGGDGADEHHGDDGGGQVQDQQPAAVVGVALPPGRVVDLLGDGLDRVVAGQVEGQAGHDEHGGGAAPHGPERQAGDDGQGQPCAAAGAAGSAGSSASRGARSAAVRPRRPMRIQGRLRGFSWESWRRSSTTVRMSCRVTAKRSWATRPARRRAASIDRLPTPSTPDHGHRRSPGPRPTRAMGVTSMLQKARPPSQVSGEVGPWPATSTTDQASTHDGDARWPATRRCGGPRRSWRRRRRGHGGQRAGQGGEDDGARRCCRAAWRPASTPTRPPTTEPGEGHEPQLLDGRAPHDRLAGDRGQQLVLHDRAPRG